MSVEVHDEWGCSRHDGLLKCLGYKSGPGGIAAQHGHQMHGMAEDIIKSGWKPYKFPDLFETGKPFTQEHRYMVLDYCNAVRTQMETYQKQYGSELEMMVEHPIKIPNLGIEISTIDVLFYVPFNFIHIIDFKTGQKPVSPTSAQMRGYTLGSMDAGPAEHFKASIFQPALSGELLSCEFTRDELEAHEKMMKLVLHAAKREHVPCTPCEYCCWCARNGECPASKAQLAMIAIDCDKYDISQSTLAILTEYAMKIEDIIGSLKQRAYAVLEAGGTLPLPDGRELMLVDGRPSYVWRKAGDAEQALIQLALTKPTKDKDGYPVLPASIEEAKAMIWTKPEPEMMTPGKAKEVFGKSKAVLAELDPLIWKVDGKKKLGIGKRAEQVEGESDHE
jgi:hypothetical protein